MEKLTPIKRHRMNSTENLHFDKEDYFHVLVFYTGYFIKEIENIFSLCLHTVIITTNAR